MKKLHDVFVLLRLAMYEGRQYVGLFQSVTEAEKHLESLFQEEEYTEHIREVKFTPHGTDSTLTFFPGYSEYYELIQEVVYF